MTVPGAIRRGSLLCNVEPWIRPVANRLVLYGIETCRDLLNSAANPVRGSQLEGHRLYAIATDSPDRLRGELSAQGLNIASHHLPSEWRTPDGLSLVIESAPEAEHEADAALLDYGTLLTRVVATEPGRTVRTVAIGLQIALLWRLHLLSARDFTDSNLVEDLVEIVAQRHELAADVAMLPPEAQSVARTAAAAFCTHAAAPWVVARALCDSRLNPHEVVRILGSVSVAAMLRAG